MRIIDYINRGGPIMYILLFLNMIGFAIIIAKFFILLKEKSRSTLAANGLANKVSEYAKDKDKNTIIELTKQELCIYIQKLEKGLNTIKIIASISPLLGLLGTVIGVLMAFQIMSESGLTDPSAFAKGISMALITTVGGLVVAIPHYVGHNYLLGMVDTLESDLEKQVLTKVL